MPDPGSSPWLPDGSRKRPRVPLPSSAAAASSAPAVWPRAQCGADLLGAPCLPPPLRPRWRAPVLATSSSCVASPPQVSVTSATSSCRDTFPPQPPSGGGVGLPPGTMMEAWTNASAWCRPMLPRLCPTISDAGSSGKVSVMCNPSTHGLLQSVSCVTS